MIIYEISAFIDENLTDGYEEYMITEHIPDVISTGFFTKAIFYKCSKGEYRIHYYALVRTDVDRYFEQDATRLRADFMQHFPSGVRLDRKILEIISHHDRS